MPGFDGTGPLGFGPGTGRGLGPCGAGMGWRRRWKGFGRGFWKFWRYGFYPSQLGGERRKRIVRGGNSNFRRRA